MKYKLNDREVEIQEVEGEVGEGVSVIHAVFLDNSKPLTEDELMDLEEKYQSALYADWYSHMASHAYDDYKDSFDN